MSVIDLLWQLQTIDLEVDDKTKRLHEIDTALANASSVTQARAAFDAEFQRLTHLRGRLHDRELEAKSLDAKLKELDQRLYSGRVTNPKELDGLEKDAQMHKRQRSLLDDQLLELMDQVEQAQTIADERKIALSQIENERAGNVEQLRHERASLMARLAELEAKRTSTCTVLSAERLVQYDRLRRTKPGRAVASIKHDACGMCGVTTPSALLQRVRAGEEIVLCPGCGRILAG
jgi:uncharacterized protein